VVVVLAVILLLIREKFEVGESSIKYLLSDRRSTGIQWRFMAVIVVLFCFIKSMPSSVEQRVIFFSGIDVFLRVLPRDITVIVVVACPVILIMIILISCLGGRGKRSTSCFHGILKIVCSL
jgi:hypothetical protein